MPFIKSGRTIPYTEIERTVEQVTRFELYQFGLHVIQNYFIPRSPKDKALLGDTTSYAYNHRMKFTGRGFNVKMTFNNDTKYGPYIEGGRSGGKPPPIVNILGWVRRHGLGEVYNPRTRKLIQGKNRRTGRFMSGRLSLDEVQLKIARKIAMKIAIYGQPGHYLYANWEAVNAEGIVEMRAQIRAKLMVAWS